MATWNPTTRSDGDIKRVCPKCGQTYKVRRGWDNMRCVCGAELPSER